MRAMRLCIVNDASDTQPLDFITSSCVEKHFSFVAWECIARRSLGGIDGDLVWQSRRVRVDT